MTPLPNLMVAPNGARLTRADHPALPVTIPQIVDTARRCLAAGADGMHLHIRDAQQRHLLDTGVYRETLAELSGQVPDLTVQITTEAVGQYRPAEQRALVEALNPPLVSVSVREMTSEGDLDTARRFYAACAETGIAVQHILYAPEQIGLLAQVLSEALMQSPDLQLLYVLGSHGGTEGHPDMLTGYLAAASKAGIRPDWMICAFGQPETACLLAAHAAGGKLRIGFENNLQQPDGSIAIDNAARVRLLLDLMPR